MGELIISSISTLISAAAVAWGMYEFIVKRRDEIIREERARHKEEMKELESKIEKRMNDFDGMLNRNSAQFSMMRESFTTYRVKLTEFEKSFTTRMDRTDRDIEKIESRLDNFGTVIKRG